MSLIPELFVAAMERLLGETECRALCNALCEAPPVSVRQNPLKPAELYPDTTSVPWCACGVYLKERPSFTANPLLHAGCFYVQEASSMFVEQAFRAMDFRPQRVLDLCAAPGGKSTLWRSLLDDGALLVANEPVRQRAQVLAENLLKWGHSDVMVTHGFAADFAPLSGFFDVVATDVPCSGEGMFRKDEGAIAEWSPAAVAMCAERQWEIVNDIWPALREGGYLVYSTCTFNRAEDEDQVYRICNELGAECVPIPVDSEWGVCGDTTGRNLPVCHFFPHHAKGEGFFLALLRKTAASEPMRPVKRKKPVKDAAAKGAKAVSDWLRESGQFKIFASGPESLAAVRQSLYEDVARVAQTVRTLYAGIPLAAQKGNKLVPEHGWALSAMRNPEAFPQVELSLETALRYLKREAIVPDGNVPRGYVVVTYQGHALGLVNHLGSRANNLYPAEWRIRSL